MENFIKISKPTIKDYLELEDKAIEYDFSNDGSGNGYKELDNGKEKFFAYMMVTKKKKFYGNNEQYDLFKDASKLLTMKVKKYGNTIDPDSKSELLQDIYKVLWNIEPLNMNYSVSIEGETLNSVNTTLNKLYEFIESKLDEGKVETETERYKRECMKTKKGMPQPVSIKYILSKYLVDGNSEILKKMFENQEVETFLKSYHTLGNFMPVPKYCNGPRGNGLLKDYWDLTLLHIFNYYNTKDDDEVVKIIGIEQKEVYKNWLDSFGNWNNFVEKNYLEAFVEPKEAGYYPKKLWAGHFDQTDVCPINDDNQGIEQCLEYFRNASECISIRGKQMIEELNKKIAKRKI